MLYVQLFGLRMGSSESFSHTTSPVALRSAAGGTPVSWPSFPPMELLLKTEVNRVFSQV